MKSAPATIPAYVKRRLMIEKKPRLRMTYFCVGFCFIGLIGSYAYGFWAQTKRHEQLLPRLSLNTIMRGVLAYHKKIGAFPSSLAQLEERVLQSKKPKFSPDAALLFINHYLYVYRLTTSPHECWIWAIPVGERREEAPTKFIVVTPARARHWTGPALRLEDFKIAYQMDDLSQLPALGMIEQDPIEFNKRKSR
jgi:hypothetical protein